MLFREIIFGGAASVVALGVGVGAVEYSHLPGHDATVEAIGGCAIALHSDQLSPDVLPPDCGPFVPRYIGEVVTQETQQIAGHFTTEQSVRFEFPSPRTFTDAAMADVQTDAANLLKALERGGEAAAIWTVFPVLLWLALYARESTNREALAEESRRVAGRIVTKSGIVWDPEQDGPPTGLGF